MRKKYPEPVSQGISRDLIRANGGSFDNRSHGDVLSSGKTEVQQDFLNTKGRDGDKLRKRRELQTRKE